MSKKSNESFTIANLTKHGYEATVKARALARAGANPHLMGWAISKLWNATWD